MRGADPNPQTDGQTPTNEHVHEACETQDRADSRTRAGRIRAETPVDRAGTKPKSAERAEILYLGQILLAKLHL